MGETDTNPTLKDLPWLIKDATVNFASMMEMTGSLDAACFSLGKTIRYVFKIFKYGIKTALLLVGNLIKIAAPLVLLVGALVNNVTKLGDSIKDSASKLNLSYSKYQEWAFVLENAGVEISTLNTGMRTFSKSVATGDSKLAKYGITATNVSDAFEQAVMYIQNLESENAKIAATTELFGNRASEMIPLMKMTNKETQNLMKTYRLMGATMSDELVTASDEFRDSLTLLKGAFQGLKNSLASFFIPIFTNLVNRLTIAIAKINVFVKQFFNIKETFDQAGKSASSANTAAEELKRTLASFDELEVLDNNSTSTDSSVVSSLTSLSDAMKDISLKLNLSDVEVDGKGVKVGDLYDKLMWALPVVAGLLTWKKTGKLWAGVIAAAALLSLMSLSVDPTTGKIDVSSFKSALFKTIGVAAAGALGGALIGGLVGGGAGALLGMKIGVALTLVIASLATEFSKNATKDNKWKLNANGDIYYDPENITSDPSLKSLMPTSNSNTGKLAPDLGTTNSLLESTGSTVLDRLNRKKLLGFASGAVLRTPTIGLMAEYSGARNNPEIVTPKNILEETINTSNGELASVFAQVGRQIVAAIENQDLTVNIDDTSIAKSAARGNNAYKRMTGTALI